MKVKLVVCGLFVRDEVVAVVASVCVLRSSFYTHCALNFVLVDEDVNASVRNVGKLRMNLVNCVQRVAAGDCGVDTDLECLCVSSVSCPRCDISFFAFDYGDDSFRSCEFASFRRRAVHRKVSCAGGYSL